MICTICCSTMTTSLFILEPFSTLSDLSTVALRHNLKIPVEKKQNGAINSDQEFETVDYGDAYEKT